MRALSGDDALLEKALKDLRAAWDAAGEGWRDRARDDFRTQHLEVLEAEVRAAARAMRELHQIMTEAQRTCT